MIRKPPNWRDKAGRQRMLDHQIRRDETAAFGFELVPESEKTDHVQRHFDSVAPKYDLMNTLLSGGIHYLWKRRAVAVLDPQPGEKVLDVCGGTGDLSILTHKKVGPKGLVTVFDINRAMMQAGRQARRHQATRSQLTYVQGNAEQISFPDAAFEKTIVGFGIRNVTHMIQGFSEMYRVLKPGGCMVCLEFSKPVRPFFRTLYDFYSFTVMPWLGELLAGSWKAYEHLPETIRLFPLPDELADILTEIGFADVQYERLTNGIAVIHRGNKPADP